ncbi:PP2C family protein-serine/threonine phosphatase [Schaalia suimastitidis]|uniref:PP2C family protein-serine/threonine phosphatase n=1 Tax=Schaalia suimastitidis TaxID=121163 RepID=UPI0004193153|nr:protein phosphatase 2C domain-containing protein [Schaalia suimastitidis]
MDVSRLGSVVATRWGAASDIGPVRSMNEDAWVAASPLFAVADGMGGHAGGERASQTGLRVLRQRLGQEALEGKVPTVDDVEAAITEAAQQVAALAHSSDPYRSPGTTLTGAMALLGPPVPYWLIFNIGDSRTYLVADGNIQQITKDHSARQEARDFEAATGISVPLPPSNVVTRALGAGMAGIPSADYFRVPMRQGDYLVISSDGMHGAVTDEVIAEVVTQGQDPQSIAAELIRRALGAGTRDNATVIVVEAQRVVGDHSLVTIQGTARPIYSVTPIPTATVRRKA